MSTKKEIKDLSLKVRFNRFKKYLEKGVGTDTYNGFVLSEVRKETANSMGGALTFANIPEIHLVCTYTKPDTELSIAVSYTWMPPHSLIASGAVPEDLVRVGVWALIEDKEITAQLVGKTFRMRGIVKEIKDIKIKKSKEYDLEKGREMFSPLIDIHLKKVKEFLWNQPNCVKFISEDD